MLGFFSVGISGCGTLPPALACILSNYLSHVQFFIYSFLLFLPFLSLPLLFLISAQTIMYRYLLKIFFKLFSQSVWMFLSPHIILWFMQTHSCSCPFSPPAPIFMVWGWIIHPLANVVFPFLHYTHSYYVPSLSFGLLTIAKTGCGACMDNDHLM